MEICVVNKAKQRLYFFRGLNDVNVCRHTLKMIIWWKVFCFFLMAMWFGKFYVRNKLELQRILNTSSKTIGKPQGAKPLQL